MAYQIAATAVTDLERSWRSFTGYRPSQMQSVEHFAQFTRFQL